MQFKLLGDMDDVFVRLEEVNVGEDYPAVDLLNRQSAALSGVL